MLISNVAIRRPVFTSMVILGIIVFGLVSFRDIGIDLMPRVEFPVITVVTNLPGADPETMETRVTDVIEEAVNTISGIKSLRSTSGDSISQVVIEFQLEKKVDVAYQEVQARLGTVRSQLPTDVKEPVVEKMDIDAAPIMTVLVSGPEDMGIRELSHIADKTVKERLQQIQDVGSVKMIGKRDRKIWLWLNADKLTGHNLTVQDVRQALLQQHVEIPGGRVETGPIELVTRTKAEFQSAAELNDLVIARTSDGGEVRLRNVGLAEDGLEEERSYAQKDEAPTIALEVRRQSGTNTVAVSDAVKKELDRLRSELSDRRVGLAVAVDSSIWIHKSVNDVLHHLILGGGAAVLIVLLFLLNFRSTFISALVLPTSVIATFMMMGVMGFTINVVTLMALSLAIGLLIDDAIVVQESIMRHVQAGKPARFAAAFATNEIGLAVIAATMSVVSVFVPTAYTKGMVGRFFFPFGMTIAFAVLLSMFVSFTLDPMLSSRLLKKREKVNFLFRFLEAAFNALERQYEKLLAFSLRHRAMVVLGAVVIFVTSMYFAKYLKTEFQPVEDQSEFNVSVRAPLGASLQQTKGIMEEVRKRVSEQMKDDIEYVFYKIGATEMQRVNEGEIYVKLKDVSEREVDQQTLMEVARKAVADVPMDVARKAGRTEPDNIKISVQQVNRMGGGGGFRTEQVQFEIRGPSGADFETLNRAAAEFTSRMKQTPGYVDVDTSFETGKPEVDVLPYRDRAKDLRVSPADIADTVRAAIGGIDVAKFKAGGDRYDIAIRFLESDRKKPEDIEGLWVRSASGKLIEIRNVARIVNTKIPVEINRYNRQREVTVLANLEKWKSQGEALQEIEGWKTSVGLPPGFSTGWAGTIEIMQESFANLQFTMLLSVIVIYMVLAAQFESFIHPFTIMLTLPLAFIGALTFLLVFGMTQSMFTMMAFIFLLGLVTKNAILLIDYTNTLRERDGVPRDLALQKAGPVRLRPILMTTAAMIAGMLPVALGTSAMRRPMAVAIIGGLVTSTLLTLLVIPVVYSLIDPLSEFIKRRFLQREPDSTSAGPEPPEPGSASGALAGAGDTPVKTSDAADEPSSTGKPGAADEQAPD